MALACGFATPGKPSRKSAQEKLAAAPAGARPDSTFCRSDANPRNLLDVQPITDPVP